MRAGARPGWIARLAGTALLAAAPVAALAGPVCFTAADNARLSFQVIEQAPPPHKADQDGYIYYPLTAAASMQLAAVIHAAPQFPAYWFQWANRSNAVLSNSAGTVVVRKANLQPSLAGKRQQRTAFTSVARANACTLAQTASVLGLPQKAQAFAAEGPVRLVGEAQQADGAPLGPPDTCVIPQGRLTAPRAGVLIDYEVQDGRSPAQTTAFLARWAQLVHAAGRHAILLLNPLDAPTQAYTGITAGNAHALVAAFDLTTIQLWSGNAQHSIPASYAAQKAMIAAGGGFDGGRVLIDFDLAGTTLADAQWVRRTIIADRLAGVLFWRNEAHQGGDCASDVNGKIAAIALGTAPGQPERPRAATAQ